ncbi:CzcE family metal-binding protein [Janthinobacterium agaricidamnosum]|uniref:CzcE family metal-binding protein n=1 Tax=Janthinobacterium agaricidamnosum NBRC 102515 = DSM 9628 TaxID=1349767 RepID=W0V4Q7_9BURK|nr:CzcE family metal-binding protein [Janthinobacterium agaricidamnosum]CDG83814.1 hypothetical protein GJA_3192 [Janthinobacterium agaricidamnosum NBRC 102515 = DSM 9628]
MQSIKNNIAAMFIAATLAPLAAMAHQGGTQAKQAFGSTAPAVAATRTVLISPATKAVNVDNGDVVTFEVDGKTFTWQFGTLRDSERFELSAIAPEGVHTHGVRIYVAQNPLYRN